MRFYVFVIDGHQRKCSGSASRARRRRPVRGATTTTGAEVNTACADADADVEVGDAVGAESVKSARAAIGAEVRRSSEVSSGTAAASKSIKAPVEGASDGGFKIRCGRHASGAASSSVERAWGL